MTVVGTLFRKKEVVAISPQASVTEAVELMVSAHVGSVIVLDREKPVGIFTERDLLNKVVSKGADPKKVKIGDVMSQPVMTVEASESPDAVYSRMQSTRCRHIPVMNQGKVVGMVTMRDLLEGLWKQKQEESDQLKDYISR